MVGGGAYSFKVEKEWVSSIDTTPLPPFLNFETLFLLLIIKEGNKNQKKEWFEKKSNKKLTFRTNKKFTHYLVNALSPPFFFSINE